MQTMKPAFPQPYPRVLDYAQYRLPSTDALDGSGAALELDGGGRLELSFADGEVNWKLEDGSDVSDGQDAYDAVQVRPGVFFVDFVAGVSEPRDRAISIAFDPGRGRAVVLVNDIVAQADDEPRLICKSSAGRVDGTENYEPLELTSDLTGRRLFCEYSDDVVIEHVYLDSRALAWQWLRCPIAELTYEVSVENNMFWKIGDDLYLLHGQEPSGFGRESLTLLLDLDQKRNVGRLFGRSSENDVIDFRVGAKLTLLGRTDYPDGYQPA